MGTSAEETGACGTVFLICRNGAAVAPSMTGWRPDILTMASRETKSVIPWETWQRVNHAREFIVGQQVFLDFLR